MIQLAAATLDQALERRRDRLERADGHAQVVRRVQHDPGVLEVQPGAEPRLEVVVEHPLSASSARPTSAAVRSQSLSIVAQMG